MAQKPPYELAPDEMATPVMVYTLSGMFWGDVITKQKMPRSFGNLFILINSFHNEDRSSF